MSIGSIEALDRLRPVYAAFVVAGRERKIKNLASLSKITGPVHEFYETWLAHTTATQSERRSPLLSTLKYILAAAAIVTALAFQPGPAAAQTAGFGTDGYSRVMWRGTDGRISLWKLDPSLNFVGGHDYGPFSGWTPVALTTNNSNFNYVLWTSTDGTASVWVLDPNFNVVTSRTFGPIKSWIAEGLGVGAATGNVGLVWKSTAGQVAVWVLNPSSLNLILSSPTHGPFFGWTPP